MKIITINDLSGYGNCSLVADIAILAALGHEPHPLCTAVLSNQSAYKSYKIFSLAHTLGVFAAEWDKIGEKPDAILVGYSPDPCALSLAASMKEKSDAIMILDPVLGDKGAFYDGLGEKNLAACRAVIDKADYITPNLTEACLLTDTDVESVFSAGDILHEAEKLCRRSKAKNTIITGVRSGGKMHNVCLLDGEIFITADPDFGGEYSGTGDLFAAAFTGELMKGISAEEAIEKAADFTAACVAEAADDHHDPQRGVPFFKFMHML